MSSVLVLTRDPGLEVLTERALASGGHEVIPVNGSDAAIRSLFNIHIDTIVLDSAIGEAEVKEFCRWLQSGNGNYPVVFLAPAGARWLVGALPINPARDELVAKPCESGEIRRAVERTLDAPRKSRPDVMTFANLALDTNSHELRGGDASVQLTPTEFRLMYYLAQQRGSIVSTEDLLENVWEFFPGTGSSELVRSHVRNLRSKLRIASGGIELVQTVPRRGYRLV
jgi:two-component system OmpR family response regulator